MPIIYGTETRFVFEMRDSLGGLDTDTVTAPTVTISKNGAAFTTRSNSPAPTQYTVTNIASGHWYVDVNTTDMSSNVIILKAQKTGMVPYTQIVYPEQIFTSLTAVATALLDTSLATGSDTNVRSVRNALRVLRNKVDASSGQIIITKEDDTTEAWRADVTTNAAAAPIITVDPTT